MDRFFGSKNEIDGIEKGWFTETETMWPGQKFSLALEVRARSNLKSMDTPFSHPSQKEFDSKAAVLYHAESDFQSILVFRSAQYGNVLVLDGVIQLTERDEFAYHEMMVHVPMNAHPAPKRVLIVGGGDGGALREVCRHDIVEQVTVVEIDPQVVQTARKYFGSTLATCFDDPRVEIVHEDAADYLRWKHGAFDVIIGDTSDPIGPAETLFQPQFYESMYDALDDQGLVCVQAECFWIHLELISDLMACCSDIFDHVEYASTMVPTYPCGQIGFLLAGKSPTRRRSCRIPVRQPDFLTQLQWYSLSMHRAAFVLPPFVDRQLGLKRQNANLDDAEEGYRCFLADPRGCTIL